MLKVRKQKFYVYCLSILLILFSIFLFREFFSHSVMEGIDRNFGFRLLQRSWILKGNWIFYDPSYWLGVGASQNQFVLSLYTLSLLLFPLKHNEVLTFFSVLLSFSFLFLFLKKLHLPSFASLFGALGFAFSFHYLSLIYSGHILVVESMLWVPILFYTGILLFDEKRKPFIFLEIFWMGISFSCLFATAPQRSLYFLFVFACFILCLFFKKKVDFPKAKKVILKFFLASVFTFMISYYTVDGWINSPEISQEKAANTWEFNTSYSLAPKILIDFFMPFYHGALTNDEDIPYWGDKPFSGNIESIGFILFLFFIYAIFRGFKKNTYVRFFAFMSIFSILLAFGKYFPGSFFYHLWLKLPFMDLFRVPSKWVSVFSFTSSILAAFGLHYFLLDLKDSSKKEHLFKIFFSLFCIFFVLFLGTFLLKNHYLEFFWKVHLDKIFFEKALFNIKNSFLILLLQLISFLVMIFLSSFSWKSKNKVILISIFSLLLIDDYRVLRPFIEKSFIDVQDRYQKDSLILELEKDPTKRVALSLLMVDHLDQVREIPYSSLAPFYLTYLFPYYQVESINRIPISRMDSFYLKYYKNILPREDMTQKQLFLFNLFYYQVTGTSKLLLPYEVGKNFKQDKDVAKFVADEKMIFLYTKPYLLWTLKDTLSRFNVYERGIYFPDNKRMNEYISRNWDFKHNILTTDPHIRMQEETKNFSYHLEVKQYEGKDILLTMKANKKSFLQMNALYDRYWHAYIDDKKVPIYLSNGITQSILVPKGEHQISFVYQKKTWVQIFTFVMMFLGFLISVFYALSLRVVKVKRRLSKSV